MGRDKGRSKRGGRGGGRRFAAQSAEEIEQRNARLAAFDERRAKRRAEAANDNDDDDDDDNELDESEREAMLVGMRVARMQMDEDNEPARERKAKGAEGIIEVDNPNLAPRSGGTKIGDLGGDGSDGAVHLTRKQREEAERAAKAAAYRKRHEMGLTEEYKRDMAKLEEVKKRREAAKAKAQAEKEVAVQMEEDRKQAAKKAGLVNMDDDDDDDDKKKKKKSSKKSSKSSASSSADIEKLDKITIKKMKPAKLKEELKLRGLDIQGTGKQLTERLLQYEANR